MPNIFIEELHLSNFRNHNDLKLKLDKNIIVITGKNGVGKTNILEAVSMLYLNKGIRNARLNNLSYSNDGKSLDWGLFSKIKKDLENYTIGTAIDRSTTKEKRIIKLNGEKIKNKNELNDYIAICFLTPDMGNLLSNSNTEKREYLDYLTSLFFKEHSSYLAKYQYFKTERKKLLYADKQDEIWLKNLEKKMAELAVTISAARLEAIDKIQNITDSYDKNGILKQAVIRIDGIEENFLIQEKALNIEKTLEEEYKNSRSEDKESGRTKIGPHRSQLIVIHKDKNKKAEICSTGEQKSLLLSITMASVISYRNRFGYLPILLLDEVIAHLDEEKRNFLFAEIEKLGCQCWLTGVDKELFESLKNKAQFLDIS